jgi:adenine-specific DNA-methyltransferase
VLPIEILGTIYEKFLGKTIRFRNGKNTHTAVVREKPEVRKAGGVFYTPQFILRVLKI